MRVQICWQLWVGIVLSFCLLMGLFLYPKQETVEPDPVVVPIEIELVGPPEPLPEKLLYSERDIECLALNSYYEARSESVAGQVAVAQVVMNRVKSNKFPNTICEVIQHGKTRINWKGNVVPVLNQCHFSWWCDGKSDIPVDVRTYHSILDLVTDILYLDTVDITEGSLYYHADYVTPYWAPSFEMVTKIDRHIFYVDLNSK